jgi:transposase
LQNLVDRGWGLRFKDSMNRESLSRLSKDELIELVLAQAAQIEALQRRVAELEARLGEPPKDSSNSSVPPSRDRKANRPGKPGGLRREASVGRAGGGRALHPAPDEVVIARLTSCPHCRTAIGEGEQYLVERYDRIELPKVKPVVTRVERHGGPCPGCGAQVVAPVPQGLEPGSPFGPGIVALAVYLRYVHAIGYQRLSRLFADLYGLTISEGALANLFLRAKPRFDDRATAILVRLRTSRLIASDETGARVNGRNEWEWVFQNDAVCLHIIRPSRGRAVVVEVLAGHRPQVWVSDLYGAQQGHAEHWQVCLAHQLRDCAFAIEAGDDVLAPRMKLVLLRICAIARRRDRLADSTLHQYRANLDRRLSAALALQPTNRHGIRLRRRYAKIRDSLLICLTDRTVPPTNNASERDIRPSTIFRKVTNGFRSTWGRDLYAGVRSVLSTARRQQKSAFLAISETLDGRPLFDTG